LISVKKQVKATGISNNKFDLSKPNWDFEKRLDSAFTFDSKCSGTFICYKKLCLKR